MSNALLVMLALGQALDIEYHNIRKNGQVGPVKLDQRTSATHVFC